MTYRDFWKLKQGDKIEDTCRDRKMRIVKRRVMNEIVGAVINGSKSEFVTGNRKIVEITAVTDKGQRFYYNSDRAFFYSDLKKI